MNIRIDRVVSGSYVDGPGRRSVVFFKGCTLACSGCQNTHLWAHAGGQLVDPALLASMLMADNPAGLVTISGGEPFQQAQGLAYLVRELRSAGARHILVYSGYTWEQLTSGVSGSWLWVSEVLDRVDLLVDGPFVRSLDHNLINWRGSSNQRVIDVARSLDADRVVEVSWDSGPRIVVTPDGSLLAPIGMASTLSAAGSVQATRRCGQTR